MKWSQWWKVPLFCVVASWVSFFLTVYLGGSFFMVRSVGEDGITQISADPLRSALFSGVLFLAILLVGGLWAFRRMATGALVRSCAVASVMYLLLLLAQLWIPALGAFGVRLVTIQNFPAMLTSALMKLTDANTFSLVAGSFAPMLFPVFRLRKKA